MKSFSQINQTAINWGGIFHKQQGIERCEGREVTQRRAFSVEKELDDWETKRKEEEEEEALKGTEQQRRAGKPEGLETLAEVQWQ